MAKLSFTSNGISKFKITVFKHLQFLYNAVFNNKKSHYFTIIVLTMKFVYFLRIFNSRFKKKFYKVFTIKLFNNLTFFYGTP